MYRNKIVMQRASNIFIPFVCCSGNVIIKENI